MYEFNSTRSQYTGKIFRHASFSATQGWTLSFLLHLSKWNSAKCKAISVSESKTHLRFPKMMLPCSSIFPRDLSFQALYHHFCNLEFESKRLIDWLDSQVAILLKSCRIASAKLLIASNCLLINSRQALRLAKIRRLRLISIVALKIIGASYKRSYLLMQKQSKGSCVDKALLLEAGLVKYFRTLLKWHHTPRYPSPEYYTFYRKPNLSWHN